MREYSCGELIFEHLKKEGVPFAVGLPGHGILAFLDAFLGREEEVGLITVRHEQSAVHLADGYYRASGRPLAVFTSVGPGAINTLVGLGTASSDSIPVIAFTANCPTYMFGKGALQAVERHRWSDFTSMARPVVKQSWQISDVGQLPAVLQQAFQVATTGRPGPVHIELPMDVQAASVRAEIPAPSEHGIASRVQGDPAAIERAAQLLIDAERPLILAGGGVILSEATDQLVGVAEHLGVPVITTLMGKGAIPEDHPLCAFYGGSKGSSCGNELAKRADVILAVGCRFAEWTTSSYRPGETYNIPPARVIHVDIDPAEIGRNYPAEVGILADARSALGALGERLTTVSEPRDYGASAYFKETQDLKAEWEAAKAGFITDSRPMTTSWALRELRQFLDRDAFVVGAAGHAQAQLFQEFPAYLPRTHISTGAFSTMGFCVPASIGVKLAHPERQVVGVMGDGDFLMTCQELATAVQYNIPVVYFLLNNYGWLSIRDLQIHHYGEDRTIGTEFRRSGMGELYNPDFVKLAESFGAYAERVEEPAGVREALGRAFAANRPAVLEIVSATRFPESEGALAGWADFPTPSYIRDQASSP